MNKHAGDYEFTANQPRTTTSTAAIRCNGERIEYVADDPEQIEGRLKRKPRPADLQHLAAAQREFVTALADLATRYEEGSITRVELLIGFESAVVTADEISKALKILAG